MEKLTGSVRPTQTSGSGHILTSEEASLLRKYLLESKPLLITSNEPQQHCDIHTANGKKNATSSLFSGSSK